MNIAICIATFKRPKGLNRVLKSIQLLKLSNITTKIIIVDNDIEKSAWDVVKNFTFSLPIVYEVESQRGIPRVRNKLVKLSNDADFIAFIDDDEVAHTNWLYELVQVQYKYDADVITGPVTPKFESSPPQWALKGKFYERKKYKTGSIIQYPRTGNVLIRKSMLDLIEGPFDERLALIGGEDTLLFYKLQQINAKCVWANDAIVEEFLPESRVRILWLFQRAYRLGNEALFIERYLGKPMFLMIPMRLAKVGYRIILGIIMLLSSIIMGYTFVIKGISNIFRGFGGLAGVFCIKYNEYKNIHGN